MVSETLIFKENLQDQKTCHKSLFSFQRAAFVLPYWKHGIIPRGHAGVKQ